MLLQSLATFEQLANQQPWFLPTVAFIFGSLIGSFLNVVIYRLPKRLEWEWERDCIADADRAAEPPPGLVTPRSRCPSCGHQLSAHENIPVLSYLVLRGRCSSCSTAISVRYPIIELLTAGVTAWLFHRFGLSTEALMLSILSWFLIALIMIDHDTQLLPDTLTLPLLWIGLLAATQNVFVSAHEAIIGAIAGYLALWSVYQAHRLITGREGMGHGDFKLLAAIGAWGGPGVLPATILLASGTGAIIGIWLQYRGHLGQGSPMAFGPFLAVAGFVSLIFGDQLQSAYLRLMF